MIRGTLTGVNVNIYGLQKFGNQAKQYAYGGIVEGLKIAYAASVKLIDAHDYSLAELAEMGHPYGIGGGGDEFGRDKSGRQTGEARGPIPFAVEETIEVQTAKGNVAGDASYRAALKAHSPRSSSDANAIVEGRIDIDDPTLKELDRWLQEGTIHMVARPWMEYVVREYGEIILQKMKLTMLVGMKRDIEAFTGEQF